MVETGEVIGYITGIAGVVLAIYSLVKQQKLEQRIKEKEKLKAFSKEIQTKLIPRVRGTIDDINNPINNWDLFFQLQGLSQSIVSKAFDEKKDTIKIHTEISIDFKETPEFTKEAEHKKISALSKENKEHIIKCLEEGKCDYLGLDASIPNDNMSYSIGTDVLLDIKYVLLILDELEKEYGNIVEEFKPELFANLRSCIIDIFRIIFDFAIDSKEIEIHLKDFDKSDDIGLWIYSKVLGQDELKSYAVKLTEFETGLENFRENLLTTSYT